MSFNVRLFGYRGMRQIKSLNNTQFTGDTVYLLDEPYEWSQLINVNGDVMAPAFAPMNPDLAQVLRVEIPNACAIRYEVNPPGRNVQAGNLSPVLTGSDNFPWAVGYSVSIVDAAGHL
jgi:hypothetical protein